MCSLCDLFSESRYNVIVFYRDVHKNFLNGGKSGPYNLYVKLYCNLIKCLI